jgi:hypothetical protein
MLADEITTDLRAIRQQAIDEAQRNRSNQPVTKALISKGISYGAITARRHGNEVKVDTSAVTGVDTDLRIRPVFRSWRDDLNSRIYCRCLER